MGIVCHCFSPPLDVPTFATTCLCVLSDARDPSSERWNCGRERCPVVILPKFRPPRKFRDLLHAANLRHGTDGFTSPSEGRRAEDFFALKIPRTWVPKASTLPLDHRSRFFFFISHKITKLLRESTNIANFTQWRKHTEEQDNHQPATNRTEEEGESRRPVWQWSLDLDCELYRTDMLENSLPGMCELINLFKLIIN